MNKFIRYLLFLTAFCSTVANADSFVIDVSFATGAGQPVLVKSIDTYCADASSANLKDGKATLNVETKGYIFSSCGYEHSSATYQTVNSQGKEQLVFELYKPYGGQPYMEIKTPHVNCTSGEKSESGYYYVDCNPLNQRSSQKNPNT